MHQCPVQQMTQINGDANNNSMDTQLQKIAANAAVDEVPDWHTLAFNQQHEIKTLHAWSNLILAFLGIEDTDKTSAGEDHDSRTVADAHESCKIPIADTITRDDCSLWSEVVSKRLRHHSIDALQQSTDRSRYAEKPAL